MIDKFHKLEKYLEKLGRVSIAFSGGVDSTFLLYVAKKTLGENTIAMTIDTPYIPRKEIEDAIEFTNHIKITHEIIKIDEIPQNIKNNPIDRCYLCKKQLFNRIIEKSKEKGFNIILDGTNFDDTKDYRPGIKALNELGIISPLKECEFTKDDIRKYLKKFNIEIHKKPSYACLLSRLPYDTNIKLEELSKIELSEEFLNDKGFIGSRVRNHGDIARIEIDPQYFKDILEKSMREEIHKKLKEFGFKYVTLDILGYRMGSLNEEIYSKVNL